MSGGMVKMRTLHCYGEIHAYLMLWVEDLKWSFEKMTHAIHFGQLGLIGFSKHTLLCRSSLISVSDNQKLKYMHSNPNMINM